MAPKAAAPKTAAPKAATKKAAAPKKATKAAPAKAAASKDAPPSKASASGSSVTITSSKVCNAFPTRANAVAAAITAAKPGVSVTIDTQPAQGRNPDRGTFSVVVTAGGKTTTLVHLPTMPRPFVAMKALDMAVVSADAIALL